MIIFVPYSNIKKLEGQREVLKSTVQEADDAQTIAHDALASIEARAGEINDNMKITNDLQFNHTEMLYAIGRVNYRFSSSVQ